MLIFLCLPHHPFFCVQSTTGTLLLSISHYTCNLQPSLYFQIRSIHWSKCHLYLSFLAPRLLLLTEVDTAGSPLMFSHTFKIPCFQYYCPSLPFCVPSRHNKSLLLCPYLVWCKKLNKRSSRCLLQCQWNTHFVVTSLRHVGIMFIQSLYTRPIRWLLDFQPSADIISFGLLQGNLSFSVGYPAILLVVLSSR